MLYVMLCNLELLLSEFSRPSISNAHLSNINVYIHISSIYFNDLQYKYTK